MKDQHSQHECFFKLYTSVHLRLYAYIMTIVHNYEDADDILQETASLLWEKFDQYVQGTNFGAWAVTIARYKAMQFLTNNKTTRMVFGEEFYKQVSEYSQQATSDVAEREKVLDDCIKELSERNKKLLSLRYHKGASIRSISQMTGRPANTLYQSFWRITESLRNCIRKRMIPLEG